MLNPIEKPTADELRKSEILFQTFTDNRRVIRAVVRMPPPPVEPGRCYRPDFVFEMHIPNDGGMATWWQVFESNPRLGL